MNDLVLRIYHALPSPARSFPASMRGYYLKSWRYGSSTERLVEDALGRERWNPEQWKVWQEEQLSCILHRAATQVPYYRQQWAERRRHGDRSSWEIIGNWSILKKSDLRENPRAFVADDCNPQRMFRDFTSGTSGTPLSIFLKKESVRKWYALYEARIRRWHGVSIKERWAILGGQLVVPSQQKKPPFWVFNAGLNQLYLSTHHLSAQTARWYVGAMRRFAPTHLIVYPSAAFVLATAILEQNLAPPKLKVIFSNAEFLSDDYRQTIAQAFGCPVRNTYGMAEIVTAASECSSGNLHLWPEVGKVEVFDDTENVPASNGDTGRLIATGLINADMPLIRYEVGDRGKLAPTSETCTCGRTLPLLAAIEGRSNDLVLTRDGRKIFWLNPVFYGLPVREAQIIQESLDSIRVRYVPAPDYTPQASDSIVTRLQARLGQIHVVLEQVVQVPRGPNGKFRAVVCNILREEHQKIE